MTPLMPLRIRIAVLTFRRAHDLEAALPRLVGQARSLSGDPAVVDVLVVDNDPDGGAADQVRAYAATADVAVHYRHEPVPGISAARNRALEASAGCDLLVFIDDDERPTEGWLAALLQTYREHGCTAVVGPVVSEYEVSPDPFVAAGRFFSRRRLPTGTPVTVAATNNLLLDLRQVNRLGLSFDPEFGLSGGGDTLFTRELHRRGGTMVWNDEAVVIDVVPAARVTRDWVLRRAYRSGNSWSRTSLRLSRFPAATRARLTAAGGVRVGGGLLRLAVGTAGRDLGRRARGLRTVARGAGILAGAWGMTYREYARLEDRPRPRRVEHGERVLLRLGGDPSRHRPPLRSRGRAS